MYLYAKNIFLTLLLCVMAGTLFGVEPVVQIDESGKQHVLALMSHSDARVNIAMDASHYARTQNIAHDLNIDEITRFFGCKTEVGNWYLKETLCAPLKRTDTLVAQRQHCIRMLVENPELKQHVELLLDAARTHEQEAMVLLSDFFKGKTCPELNQLEVIKQQNPMLYQVIRALTTGAILRTLSFGTVLLAQAGVLFGAYKVAANYTLVKEVISAIPAVWYALDFSEKISLSLSLGSISLLEGFCLYGLHKECSTGAEKRNKIHALHQLIKISEQMQELSQKATLLLQNQFSAQIQADTSGVISAINTSRYAPKTSYLFAVPLVHTFLYKLFENEHQLAPLFASIAEIDAYNAIATKMLEARAHTNKFCFATFLTAAKPAVETTGFWNILVKNPVVNSISETQNIILTGPNAGGKTTSIRALLQNITLAQTYGVAAAEQFALTPFDVIDSYLNISDDLVNGLSLFASEVKRAQGIVEIIKALQPNEKYFCALDELFTGTVAEDGEKCAYQFIQRVTKCDKALFIYATHFGKLTELETQQLPCVNYKVDAPVKGSDGRLVYPYTLNRGINTSHVALDLAGEANLFA